MLYCRAVWVALEREPVRSAKAIRMLTTMMFWRFWMSRSVSIVSSRRNPTRHWVRLVMSRRPVLLVLPPFVTLPSASADAICSDTSTGMPSTAPSCPCSRVALGPSLSKVRKLVMLRLRM